MSIYVTSDLHGYPLNKLQNKLKEIGFDFDDHLYILGDCIDRGSDGLQLLRWIMSQPNVTLLLGNHEAMLLDNRFLFDGDSVPAALDLKGEQRNSYCVWTSNGGYATIDAMQQFSDAQIKHIFRFLEKAPLYKEIEVNGNRFILTHSGLGSFAPDKPLSKYSRFDLLWTRPSLNTRYYEDGRKVIFGHTPTVLLGPEYKGKPIFADTWIDIDVGAGIGMNPALLRLDDFKVIYFEPQYISNTYNFIILCKRTGFLLRFAFFISPFKATLLKCGIYNISIMRNAGGCPIWTKSLNL